MGFGGETGENPKNCKNFLILETKYTFCQEVSIATRVDFVTNVMRAAKDSWPYLFLIFIICLVSIHSPPTLQLRIHGRLAPNFISFYFILLIFIIIVCACFTRLSCEDSISAGTYRHALKQVWGSYLLQLHEPDGDARSPTSKDRCTNPGKSVPFYISCLFLFILHFLIFSSFQTSHWGQCVIQVWGCRFS
jgi:hypothetical protein